MVLNLSRDGALLETANSFTPSEGVRILLGGTSGGMPGGDPVLCGRVVRVEPNPT